MCIYVCMHASLSRYLPAAFDTNWVCPPTTSAPLVPAIVATPPLTVARHEVALAKSENCTELENA